MAHSVKGWCIASFVCLFCVQERIDGAPNEPDSEDGPRMYRLKDFREEFGVTVVNSSRGSRTTTEFGVISSTYATARAIERYTPLLRAELALYPLKLIKKLRIKKIVVCQELTFKEEPIAGLFNPESRIIYMDIRKNYMDRMTQRCALHHEIFHIVDYVDDGEMHQDPKWASLNPSDFEYGEEDFEVQSDPRPTSTPGSIPGFLTGYSTTAVEEDKAQLFAYMMCDYSLVSRYEVKDKIMKKKCDMMKKLLQSFCSDMNPSFWSTISRRRLAAN